MHFLGGEGVFSQELNNTVKHCQTSLACLNPASLRCSGTFRDGEGRWKMKDAGTLFSLVMLELDHIFTRLLQRYSLLLIRGGPHSLILYHTEFGFLLNSSANMTHTLFILPRSTKYSKHFVIICWDTQSYLLMRPAPASCSPESCRPNYQAGHWAASLHRNTAAALAGRRGFTV